MIAELNPGIILIVGALLVPFLRGHLRSAYLVALPLIALWHLSGLPTGELGQVALFEFRLVTLRVDKLSQLFGAVFLIAAFLGLIYSLHVEDTVQHVATLVYAGSAIGATFAGDLITLFLFWEGTAIASVFLIWASRSERAYGAGIRYLIIQIGSGVLLLAGVLIHAHATGSIAFTKLGIETPGGILILLAIGIKCAFPLLHSWLPDTYPEATPTGTVILSAFTTKLAVYALARGYPGTEILVPIGATMAVFPVVFALIENNLRRVLSYSLNIQLGFMVVAVGIGSELAINGAAAHAASHILYKSLLFMAMGAVLHRLGTVDATNLGGLYRSMPWTAAFCIVGAASIAAVPLFCGFISKAMILTAAMNGGYQLTWLVLLAASAAVLHYCSIKIPYFTFYGPDSGKRCEEAPGNMLVAMAITAALCVLVGLFPGLLYRHLPFAATYEPYTIEHIVTQAQLLAFSALSLLVLTKYGLYPLHGRGINLDIDWLYRRLGHDLLTDLDHVRSTAWAGFTASVAGLAASATRTVRRYHAPDGVMGRSWPTGTMALWTTILLAAYLILSYV